MNTFSCWFVNPGFLLLVQYFRKSLFLKPMGVEGCSLEVFVLAIEVDAVGCSPLSLLMESFEHSVSCLGAVAIEGQ